MADLEKRLKDLLNGEHSHLHLTFNDHHANYMTAAEADADGREFESVDWVSEEEHQKAIEQDSVWCLQWYPETPVGFYRIGASSLEALLPAPPTEGKE